MSLFNEDQEASMRSIETLPDDKVCWCGWGEKDHCPCPTPCDPTVSLADRHKATCPECGGYPWKPNGIVFHRTYCSQNPSNVISEN